MVSNTATVEEKINVIDKSDESTETMETADMSVTSRVSFDEYKAMVDGFNERLDHDESEEKQQHAVDPSENDSSRISFDEYTTIVDNLNGRMSPESEEKLDDARDNPAVSNGEKIKSHYAGIWFPECKDCRCCQGFKYGCHCGPTNNGVCVCVTGGVGLAGVTGFVSDEISVMTMNSYEVWNQQSPLQCRPAETQQSRPLERRLSKRRLKILGAPPKTDSPCRFFLSGAGCRYGDSCPFNHTK